MSAFEKHYSVSELAELWKRSDDTIRRWFQGEPGVAKTGEGTRRVGRKYVRRYHTLLIPESIALRVYNRMLTKKIA
jgi:hypothetical protein